MARRCKTTLQNLKHFTKLETIIIFFFSYHKTKWHYHSTFTSPETNLHFRKQINKTWNTFTSPETNLQVAKQIYKWHQPERKCTNSEFDPEVIMWALNWSWWSSWWPKTDSDRVVFCLFSGKHMSRLTRFSFSCGRSLEFLNGADQTEGPNAQGTTQQPDNAKQSKCSITLAIWSMWMKVNSAIG